MTNQDYEEKNNKNRKKHSIINWDKKKKMSNEVEQVNLHYSRCLMSWKVVYLKEFESLQSIPFSKIQTTEATAGGALLNEVFGNSVP